MVGRGEPACLAAQAAHEARDHDPSAASLGEITKQIVMAERMSERTVREHMRDIKKKLYTDDLVNVVVSYLLRTSTILPITPPFPNNSCACLAFARGNRCATSGLILCC